MTRARVRVLLPALVVILLTVPATPVAGVEADERGPANLVLKEPVVVNAAAVAQTDRGLVGSVATISISVAENGSGHIFIDTVPLTQVDMQGSARLAVKVAGAVTGINTNEYDFFFVVRSNSQVIGGPSAGGIMTVGTVAALKGWDVNRSIMMTGTINPDGSIGPVGGVPEKAAAAADVGANLFLYPEGQQSAVLGGRVVDLPTYCKDALHVGCRAVTDVEDAVRHITGHAFERKEVPANVTDERYQAILGPLSRELLSGATDAYASARANYSAATGLTSSVRQNLDESLTRANRTLEQATDAERDGLFYTSASKAFQTGIEARYVELVLDFFAAEDANAFVERAQEDAATVVAGAAEAARSARPQDETQLQAVGAAQVRASEAERLLTSARATRDNATTLPEFMNSLWETAFAVERARTVHWWLSIGDELIDGGTTVLDRERLQRAALDSVEAAEEVVTYSELVLTEAGALPPELVRAREMLEDARRDYNAGYYAAATFEALEAEVRGSLALELLGYTGGIPESKVDRARTQAAEAISVARERGVEPILSESYFEFGETLEEPSDRLAFYNLARTIARLTEFVQGVPSEPRASRFVGESDIPQSVPLVPASHVAGYLALGLSVGAGVAAIALARVASAKAPRAGPPAPPRDDALFTEEPRAAPWRGQRGAGAAPPPDPWRRDGLQ